MDRIISPLERSQQIMRSIEQEEIKKKKAKPQTSVKSSFSSESAKETNAFSKLIELTEQNVLSGIIFSEILGKPKAMRRRF